MLKATTIKEKALSLGFDLVGIAPAGLAPHGRQLLDWCGRGYAGEMAYMTRSADARADTRVRFPWAKSIVCVAMSYCSPDAILRRANDIGRGSHSSSVAPAGADRADTFGLSRRKTPDRPLPPHVGVPVDADKAASGQEREHLLRRSGEIREDVARQTPATPRAENDTGPRESQTACGRVSCYAWGDDYHDVMGPALAELESFARAHGATRTKSYVDTGPVLERDWAALAGLGWIGKNTTLISQRLGSWLFLGTVLLDVELTPDGPHPDRCGTCTECIDACPTGALRAPNLLDSRLCISYLTIEHKGAIPQRLRPLIGDWVFGCDVCQTVCPWNVKAAPVPRPEFAPRPGLNPIDLEFALRHPEEPAKLTAGTPVERAKGTRLLRNLMVAAGNSRSPGAARALEPYAVKPPAELAELVSWALKRIRG